MGPAFDPAGDSQHVAEADIEPVGEHDKAGGNVLVVRQDDSLPIRARLDRHRFCDDTADGCRDFLAQRMHQRTVEDGVLEGRVPDEHMAESGDPSLAAQGRLAQQRIGKAGVSKARKLRIARLVFPREIRRTDLMRIDQGGCDPGASQHRGRGGAGQIPADDGNVGIFHPQSGQNGPIVAPVLPRDP